MSSEETEEPTYEKKLLFTDNTRSRTDDFLSNYFINWHLSGSLYEYCLILNQ